MAVYFFFPPSTRVNKLCTSMMWVGLNFDPCIHANSVDLSSFGSLKQVHRQCQNDFAV